MSETTEPDKGQSALFFQGEHLLITSKKHPHYGESGTISGYISSTHQFTVRLHNCIHGVSSSGVLAEEFQLEGKQNFGGLASIIDKPKHAGGRPPKLDDEQRSELFSALSEYINKNDDPTIAKFLSTDEVAIQYNVNDSNLYDWTEFSVLIKRAVKKQEGYLLEQAGSGKYNPTLAIFRLKQPQHGYSDRQELTGAGGKDLIPQELSKEQASQLMALRAKRAATD